MVEKTIKHSGKSKKAKNSAYITVSTPCECCGSPLKVNINSLLARLKELNVPITAVCKTCGNEERITYTNISGD